MRQFFQKHEPQTMDAYVSELTRMLSRTLPRDKAEQIAWEAKAHLADHTEDLCASGFSLEEAHMEAISGFGPVKRYARAATLNAYGDRNSARWRLVGRLATVNLIAAPTLAQLGCWMPFHWVPQLMSLLLLMILLAALGARLPQTRTYSDYLAAAVLVLFVGAGFRYVPHPLTPAVLLPHVTDSYNPLRGGVGVRREKHPQDIVSLETQQAKVAEEIKLLRTGLATYSRNAPIPVSLIQNGRYVVPLDYGWQDGLGGVGLDEQDIAAFQLLQNGGESQNRYHHRMALTPYETVATRQAAAVIWQRDGHKWLASKRHVLAASVADKHYLTAASGAPLTFNTGAASYYAASCVQWGLCLLLVDYVMAHLGRAVWISVRNRRRSQAA